MDTARVFFLPNPKQVSMLRVVTLASHLNNVRRLVKAWAPEKAFLDLPQHLRDLLGKTKERLIRAAQRHDEGKRQRFKLEKVGDELTYSCRGHRFDVADPDLYVDLLIRLHHNAFSVADINGAIAQLRLEEHFRELAPAFPLDAYALQMCDQITAEVEIYALDESAQPRKPAFMEFKTEKLDESRIALDPYPFDREAIVLCVEYADLSIPGELVSDVQKMQARVRDAQPPTLLKEVTLCPMM